MDLSNIEIIRQIARGGQAVVYEVSIEGSRYAYKKASPVHLLQVKDEMRIIKSIPDITPQIMAEVQDGYIMELFDSTVEEKLSSLDNDYDRMCVIIQFAEVLQIANEGNVFHRDVKPQNALYKDGRIVLTDFGFGKIMGDSPKTVTGQVKNYTHGYSDVILEKRYPELYKNNPLIWDMGQFSSQLAFSFYKEEQSLTTFRNKATNLDLSKRYQNWNDYISDLKKVLEDYEK